MQYMYNTCIDAYHCFVFSTARISWLARWHARARLLRTNIKCASLWRVGHNTLCRWHGREAICNGT